MSVAQISLELSEETKRNQETKLAQVFAMHRQSFTHAWQQLVQLLTGAEENG